MALSKALAGKSRLAGQMYTYTLTITEPGVSITDEVEGRVKRNPVISVQN